MGRDKVPKLSKAEKKKQKAAKKAGGDAGSADKMLDPKSIRYTHSRIRPVFSGCGRPIEQTMEEIESGQITCEDLPRITVMQLEDGETYVSLNNRRLYVLKWAREKGLLAGNKIGVRVKEQSTGTSKVATKYSLDRCSNTAKFMPVSRKQDASEEGGEDGADGAGAGAGAADDVEDSDEAKEEEAEKAKSKSKHRGKQRKDRGHSDFVWGATAEETSTKEKRKGGKGKAAATGDAVAVTKDVEDDIVEDDAENFDRKKPAVRSGVDGVRNKYAAHGSSTAYYAEEGGKYTNPHDGAIKAILSRLVVAAPEMWSGKVLDLACGSGEATEALVESGLQYNSIDACDPFTLDAYYARCRPFFPSVDAPAANAAEAEASAAVPTATASGAEEEEEEVVEEGAAEGVPVCSSSLVNAVETSASSAGAAAEQSGAVDAVAVAVAVAVSDDDADTEAVAAAAAAAVADVDAGDAGPNDRTATAGIAEEEGTNGADVGLACSEIPADVDDESTTVPDTAIDAATKEALSDQVFTWSFEDVAAGVLADRPHYSAVVCSFALHLCEPSYLATTCSALAMAADHLIVLTPHKRPDIKPAWGWTLVSDERDDHWRVRCRHYTSMYSSEQ